MATERSALKRMLQGEPLVHRVDGQYPNSYYWVPHSDGGLRRARRD